METMMSIENKIIVGDNIFEIKMPEDLNYRTYLEDWCRLIEKQKNRNDIWITIPELPQYKFKNLSIEGSPFMMNNESVEMTITFKCDKFNEIS